MNAIVSFSYDAIAPDVAADLRAVAGRIRERGRRATADMIEIGRDLMKVKAQLEHGAFLAWLHAEFAMSERSARYYMAAAQWAEGKTATVADLPVETVRLLSAKSTPPEIADKVLATVESGKRIVPEVVNHMVKQARKEADQKKREAAQRDRRKKRLAPDTIKKLERDEARELGPDARRKLKRLRRSLGPEIADRAFAKWQTGRTQALAELRGILRDISELLPRATDEQLPRVRDGLLNVLDACECLVGGKQVTVVPLGPEGAAP